MQNFSHGGHIFDQARKTGIAPKELLDFSANINPLGYPEWLAAELSNNLELLVHYPDQGYRKLLATASSHYQAKAEEIIFANGSTEILYFLPRCTNISQALIPVPSYVDYLKVCLQHGFKVQTLPLKAEDNFLLQLERLEKQLITPCLVFLGQPNNPTGQTFDSQGLRQIALNHPECLFIVDEAFADFIPGQDRLYQDRPANVLVLLSLTKFYAIPGLRLGLAIGSPDMIRKLKSLLPPWSVNTLAQAVGCRALEDTDFQKKSQRELQDLQQGLFNQLQAIDQLTVFPSKVNFFLCQLKHQTVPGLAETLLAHKILIRNCANYKGLDNTFFRIAIKDKQANEYLVQALTHCLDTACQDTKRQDMQCSDTAGQQIRSRIWPSTNSHIPPRTDGKLAPDRVANLQPGITNGQAPLFFKRKIQSRIKRPAVMLQGTSSNAGKSILSAGLCRIFLQDGYKVAPFKAQNMSLNSFVTKDGGEMGRAQVLQSQACRLDPDVRMNPVLLKPSSETGSQVILLGKPVANMDVQSYIKFKQTVVRTICQAYDELASAHEIMVLEGAGSPAEINLKAHDLTNMNMAHYAQAKVLLVGDIDRGGVFASFAGTVDLLDPEEQKLIAGLVINKFRGQENLLQPAIDFTWRKTGKPTLGVIPFLQNLGLPEEDSVTFKSGWDKVMVNRQAELKIGCLDLPHISNFTDLEPLIIEPDVQLQIISRPEGLTPDLDLLILPGSKNVLADLEFLFKNGLAKAILEMAKARQCVILGICGGFQILGQKIADPLGLESRLNMAKGLGLLNLVTELSLDKTLTQVQGIHLPSNLRLKGYEIHHGQTLVPDIPDANTKCVVKSSEGRELGFARHDELIWGTYVHGLFDQDEFRRWFLDQLRIKKGLQPLETIQARFDVEEALDRLAAIMRKKMDIKILYKLLGLGPRS